VKRDALFARYASRTTKYAGRAVEQAVVPYKRILFVCINKRQNGETCCADSASEAIAEALKARIKALGAAQFVRVSRSGCQDVCAKGPNVMAFPDNVWYYGVTLADIGRIAEEAVRGIEPGVSSPAAPA
jgi:(2Fe-2S) ferredoxin